MEAVVELSEKNLEIFEQLREQFRGKNERGVSLRNFCKYIIFDDN